MKRPAFKHTDLSRLRVGPIHPDLPGPIALTLLLDGESVVEATVERGFAHRGLEKVTESRLWHVTPAYAARLEPEASAFSELVFCLAVEELAYLTAPPRAQSIRMILCELSRIASNLLSVSHMARLVGSGTFFHYVQRDREKILDLIELLTGARFNLNFLKFGGVKADISEGFVERVLETCEALRYRLKEYNDLFSYNTSFLLRTRGVGQISAAAVQEFGLTGPNAWASGVFADSRIESPYCGYDLVEHQGVTPVVTDPAKQGDCHARYIVRLQEILASLEILQTVCHHLPVGEFARGKIDKDFAPASGEAYARVESPRGLLGCHVISTGGRSPARTQFRVPSMSVYHALPHVLKGISMEDFPVFLASLDLSVAELDR